MRSGKAIRGEEVEYALLDPALFRIPLFSSFVRGERPAGLTFKFTHDQDSFTLACWEGLDARDQSILFAAVGMAGMQRIEVTGTSETLIDEELWSRLDGASDEEAGGGLLLNTTRYALLKAARHSTRDNDYARLKDSLFRLSMVSYRIQNGRYDWSQRLLRYVATADGRIVIILCTRFADVAIRGQHIRMSLTARGDLKGDVAQLLHARLSEMTRQGQKGLWMGIDSMAKWVWGTKSTESTERGRRVKLRKALAQLESIGWKIEWQGESPLVF